ncbi:pre-mRNA-processing protein 40A-like isoform X2 [Bidens hawaiensis]|uniref:pre-mRNA-processing protein 40A-like isoform X2 n=1 Tax=Bidens hawaiensis TaxID=980011 RepID=UPI0040490BF4
MRCQIFSISSMANNSQYPGIQPPPRPHGAAMGPPPNSYPPVAIQFRPAGPLRPPTPYMPIVSQQFLAVGRPNMVSQPMQHLPPRPGLPGPPLTHGMVPPPPPPLPAAQDFLVPDVQPQAQQAVPVPNNYGPGLSLTYNLPTAAAAQVHVNAEATSQYQPISSINLPSFPQGGPTILQPTEQTLVASSGQVTADLPKAVEKAASDWIEHTSHKGKRYYYNKKTKISSWEKPLELMSLTERADASTNWKECPAPDGRKYYYNKVAKQSKWKIPDELKLAREQWITKCNTNEQQSAKDPDNETVVPSVTPGSDSPSSQPHEPGSSPATVANLIPLVPSGSVLTSESKASIECSKVTTNAAENTPMLETLENVSAINAVRSENGNIEESNRGTVTNDNTNAAALEEKTVDHETVVYETKQEAKNAFKALLESVNVASDWTWDQTMQVIINDRRYGALRTMAERKQAFNEFLVQKKKHEAEQRRAKQKKAREEFKKMLEESKELTVSTKWSKAVAIFEDDDRFKAVERLKDREDIYDDYIMEREKKERSKYLEEQKKNKKEYIEFLKSCDFLTASSQWRKVQDRLEADERCLRLEKIDRLEIFQEYIRDLEKDEEEQRKLRTEELRKTERKNRDEFRKLMDGHIASGTLTSKSHWRDYCIKVKDLPAYLAVSSNSSGATPKDLFEDVIEELEKQYTEDRDHIKEIVKMKKVSILSTWTLEDFKNAVAEDLNSHPVSDVNLKLVFDELLERVREREEKEAKKRKRVADDFYTSLTTSKEITSSSRWEDVKPLFENRLENWFCVDESFFKDMFDKHITELKKARDERKHREDKAKDRDRRTEKSRRDKDGKGKSDKRRRDEGRDSHRHSTEHKRTKQGEQQSSASGEHESRHKRHKRDHRRDDQRVAEDGEVW